MPTSILYSCYDFRLRSEVPLSELALTGEDPRVPEVGVRYGRVPERLAGSLSDGALQTAGGEALLTVDRVGRFLVRGGEEIVVDPAPLATERSVRLFLLGSALGIVCHQRGLLPLHANAVAVGGFAAAFCGPSGIGKSTLAAYFARAGYAVLCDDVCAISFDESGRPFAWPGLPRLKLWGEAVAVFGHDPRSLERAVDGLDKYHVPLPPAGDRRPVPLRSLYLLARAEPGEPDHFRRVRGHRALGAVMEQTYRNAYLAPMGLAEQNFRHCAALAASVEIFEARRTWGYDVFEREARRLEEHMLASE